MSGGSMDYPYGKIENAPFAEHTLLRRAFRQHLLKVADACRSIEWNDSGDGDSHEEENIRACLAPGALLEEATASARLAMEELRALLETTP